MKANQEYIRRKFDEYNKLMFDGQLEQVTIKLSTARGFLGKVRCRCERGCDGILRYKDFTLLISSRLDLPEPLLEDTIIHEMIHYWILSSQIQDSAPHGKIFRAKMREINERFNRHITITHKSTKEELDRDKEVRLHLVCVTRFKGDRWGITIASKSRVFRLWDAIPTFPEVIECSWFISRDPFFNRYPRALTPKIYPVRKEELEAHRSDFKPLTRRGNTIIVGEYLKNL